MENKDKGTILIADDRVSMANLVVDIIEEFFPEYLIEYYKSGSDLQNRLEKDVSSVELAIIDNHMPPGLSGSEIIEKYSPLCSFNFILHYGEDDNNLIGETAKKKGAFGYIRKPAGITDFQKIISSALKK